MAINNSANRVLNLVTNGLAYAKSAKEIDTLNLTQGQVLTANAAGVPTAVSFVGQNGIVIDATSTPGQILVEAPQMGTPGTTWVSSTTNTTMAKKYGYVASSSTSLVFTLPASPAVGDTYEVVGSGQATFTIQAPSGGIVFLGDTASAAGGSAVSTLGSDSANIVCVVGGASPSFSIKQSTGNFNIA